MKMPSFDVNEVLKVDIRLKGVKEYTVRVKIASWMLHLVSKVLKGSGCSVEMILRPEETIQYQDPRYRLSVMLEQLEQYSAAIKLPEAERKYQIEDAKNAIFEMLRVKE